MLSKWPIRNKLLIGIGLLLVIVGTLSCSGFFGMYAYRSAVKSYSGRANELPLAQNISKHVSELRLIMSNVRDWSSDAASEAKVDRSTITQPFAGYLLEIASTLGDYREHLLSNGREDLLINDSREEWETVRKIDTALARINEASRADDWPEDPARVATIRVELERLQNLSWALPSFLHARIHDFAREARREYRGLIILTWIMTVSAGIFLAVFIRLFYTWVFRPLRVLVKGSRRVAGGEFGYRISLETHDEMSELADAMNEMTARFEAIRDGLDREVQERTKQVVRSEQLASVGFLAAGVAHEINNPLASIALCAESLESRIAELLEAVPAAGAADREVIRNYLRMIQNEAFRCKGITEGLLDFSRMGDVTRHSTDLRELVQGVIDMVAHLGTYQDKHIEFAPGDGIVAPVNSQELKQVVLNLITNGLDSLSPGGVLNIELQTNRGQAEIAFTDNGCGMTDEVLKHLFEPFFTRRRCGQGTGLGLSITYRIVADHGGHIDVHSDGPGKGSRFCVTLPLTEKQREREHRYQAA